MFTLFANIRLRCRMPVMVSAERAVWLITAIGVADQRKNSEKNLTRISYFRQSNTKVTLFITKLLHWG